jgi:hypothetical protein
MRPRITKRHQAPPEAGSAGREAVPAREARNAFKQLGPWWAELPP